MKDTTNYTPAHDKMLVDAMTACDVASEKLRNSNIIETNAVCAFRNALRYNCMEEDYRKLLGACNDAALEADKAERVLINARAELHSNICGINSIS